MHESGVLDKQSFEGWAVLELMGHRRLGGYIRQVEMFGSALCRIDVPESETEPAATQFYSGGAIYCVTPTDEETARRVAEGYRPAPVNRWELRAPKRETVPASRAVGRYDDESKDADFGDEDEDDSEGMEL